VICFSATADYSPLHLVSSEVDVRGPYLSGLHDVFIIVEFSWGGNREGVEWDVVGGC